MYCLKGARKQGELAVREGGDTALKPYCTFIRGRRGSEKGCGGA